MSTLPGPCGEPMLDSTQTDKVRVQSTHRPGAAQEIETHPYKFDTARLEQAVVKGRCQSHLENTMSAHGPLTGASTHKWNQFKNMMT